MVKSKTKSTSESKSSGSKSSVIKQKSLGSKCETKLNDKSKLSSSLSKSHSTSLTMSNYTTSSSLKSLLGRSSAKSSSTIGASQVKPRTMLSQDLKSIQKKILDIKINHISLAEMHQMGYEVDMNSGRDNLFAGKNVKFNEEYLIKIINLNIVSDRYRSNLKNYGIKILKFIGEKPLYTAFPKVIKILLVEHCYYIYMKPACTTTLYDLIIKKEKLSLDKIRKWAKQITEGVSIIHKMGIAHRFLKLKHLLLDHDNIKIMGWSKAVFFYDTNKHKLLLQQKEKRIRKNNFLPPEAFSENYDPSKADIWSIGIVIVGLLTNRYPFHVRTKNFMSQWRKFTRKHDMNPVARNLCNKIFVLNPKKRIKVDKILADKFFQVHINKLSNTSVRGSIMLGSTIGASQKSVSLKAPLFPSYESKGSLMKSFTSKTSKSKYSHSKSFCSRQSLKMGKKNRQFWSSQSYKSFENSKDWKDLSKVEAEAEMEDMLADQEQQLAANEAGENPDEIDYDVPGDELQDEVDEAIMSPEEIQSPEEDYKSATPIEMEPDNFDPGGPENIQIINEQPALGPGIIQQKYN